MRVWHFINKDYGLENLRNRRLKIARLNELNDPFEFFGINLADKNLRYAFNEMKSEIAKHKGLLCFSRNWQNPVQWSHYADKHKGLCLGFDIPNEYLEAVIYSRSRLSVTREELTNLHPLNIKTVTKFLVTKYSHWSYEQEERCFVNLEKKDPVKDLYFAEFSNDLKLSAVIVGAQSNVSRKDIQDALGELAPAIETFKARLAFNSFKVVRQRDSSLWS